MNCEEFLRQFRQALDGKVPENVIQDNVNYYRSYINGQTASGRSELEVINMLGDPRLLAKTTEESSKFASESQESRNRYAGEYGNYDYADNRNNGYTENVNNKHFRLPRWLITAIVMIVVVLALTVVFRVFVSLAPVIIAFLVGSVLVRTIRGWLDGK